MIGLGAFAELLVHPAAYGVPVILETPEVLAGHREQLDRLRHLSATAGEPPG